MQRRVGHVVIESIAAERPKFTAPMVLVHGLWCAAPVWRPFMGYLAHRGWTCHALSLRGRGEAKTSVGLGALRFADYLNDVRSTIEACDAPPVVVGHDLGGLLALTCAPAPVRAIVAMAPVVPRVLANTASPALFGWRARLAAMRARPLPAPRGKLATAYFGAGVPGGTTADASAVPRDLASDDFRLPDASVVPTLVMAGERDLVCSPTAVHRLAQHCGATFLSVAEAGHAMPWEHGWGQRVAEIHRWVVQRLGEPLLALRDEEEE